MLILNNVVAFALTCDQVAEAAFLAHGQQHCTVLQGCRSDCSPVLKLLLHHALAGQLQSWAPGTC